MVGTVGWGPVGLLAVGVDSPIGLGQIRPGDYPVRRYVSSSNTSRPGCPERFKIRSEASRVFQTNLRLVP